MAVDGCCLNSCLLHKAAPATPEGFRVPSESQKNKNKKTNVQIPSQSISFHSLWSVEALLTCLTLQNMLMTGGADDFSYSCFQDHSHHHHCYVRFTWVLLPCAM